MKTRGEIINGMCMTSRHDYGLLKEDITDVLSSGMTTAEQQILYTRMYQLFHHNCEELYLAAERYEKLKKAGSKYMQRFVNSMEALEDIHDIRDFDDLVDQL